jgi:hypothetical protein
VDNLTNLNEAIKTLRTIRMSLASGSSVIWNKVNNAINHLETQVQIAIAE